MSKSISICRLFALASTAAVAVTLSACAGMPMGGTPKVAAPYSQAALPAAVQVQAGHRVTLELIGVGEITYQCGPRKDDNSVFEWVFVGPVAKLNDRSGKTVGKYYGPPATWEHMDGSKITGVQLAVAPSPAGNIPLQLVKANPATGTGAFTGVSHIQRVATVGGVAPAAPCSLGNWGTKQVVSYASDYILYRPN